MNGKILAIYSSPRASGFSSIIHDRLLSPFYKANSDIKIFNSYTNNVQPCDACAFCKTNDRCVYDDMTSLYEDFLSCSLLTVSSPIYFSGLTSTLKAVIDRCQLIWNHKKYVKPKRALFIAASGSDYTTVFNGARLTMRHFFNTLNASFDENDFIFLAGTDNMKHVPDDVCARAESIGKKYVVLNTEDTETINKEGV